MSSNEPNKGIENMVYTAAAPAPASGENLLQTLQAAARRFAESASYPEVGGLIISEKTFDELKAHADTTIKEKPVLKMAWTGIPVMVYRSAEELRNMIFRMIRWQEERILVEIEGFGMLPVDLERLLSIKVVMGDKTFDVDMRKLFDKFDENWMQRFAHPLNKEFHA